MAEQVEQKQEEATAPSFTLTYFPIAGRGQPLRAAAVLGGICYRERIITFAEHGEQKAKGLRRWSGVPEITLHDKDGNDVMTVGQSNICLQLIGTMGGLYPKDNMLQAVLVDEIMASVEDVFAMLIPAYLENDQDKKKAMCEEFMKEKIPYWCGKFENRLAENEARGSKSGYFVGDTLTVADLKFHSMVAFCKNMPGIDMDKMFKDYPKMGAFFPKVDEDEKMKAFDAAFKAQIEKYNANTEENEIIVNKEGKCVYLSL